LPFAACRFVATVKSEASAARLRQTFAALPDTGKPIDVRRADDNAAAISEADVVLLWCAVQLPSEPRRTAPQS